MLTSWDGRWYLEIVRGGYPTSIPADITYFQLEARAAFFPVYPWIVRAVDVVLPGGDTLAALFTNFVLGAISVVLVGLLARQFYSVGVAARSMTLYAIFPGSFVLSFAYAEATFIVLAALCLLLLVEERWLLAGVVAAVATGTRPERGRARRGVRRGERACDLPAPRLEVAGRRGPLPHRLHRLPALRRRPGRRARRLVPRPARGVVRGHELRGDSGDEHVRRSSPVRSDRPPMR